MEEIIEIPEDVEVSMEDYVLSVSSGENEIVKKFSSPRIDIEAGDGIKLVSRTEKRKDLAMLGTYRAHIKNMFKGVTEGFTYKLKTVYAHFPMTVKKQGDKVVIQNFIGERSPRRVKIPEGVNVSIDDDEITVEGIDKDVVSQTAANIEQKCHKGNRDPRRFQDGVYITQKGK